MEDIEIDLPLVNIDKKDVLGALLVHGENGETMKDSLMKLQTWVMTFADEQVAPLRESGCFTDEEMERIKNRACVISPITLTLYVHWLQMEAFQKLPDSEKERILLEKVPDQFKARYKGNASCRDAREVSPDEEDDGDDDEESAEGKNRLMNMSFEDFLKVFGNQVLDERKAV